MLWKVASSFHADRLMWLMAPGQMICFLLQSSFWLLCTEYGTLKALDYWILSLDSYFMIYWWPLSVSYLSIDITRIFLSCSWGIYTTHFLLKANGVLAFGYCRMCDSFQFHSRFWLLWKEYWDLEALNHIILSLDSYLMSFWLPLSVSVI